MKLIDEKEVEEAAKNYATRNGYFVINPNNEAGIRTTIKGFSEGASFSEQKLLPIMVEFAKWCPKNYEHLSMNLWQHGSPIFITTADISFTTK